MSETKDLVAALQNDRSERRRAAWKRYAELLRTATGTTAEVAQMKTLQAELGRSVEDVASDRDTLRRADEATRRIKHGDGLEEAWRTAQGKCEEYRAETERIVAQRREAQATLNAAREGLENRQVDARDASARLAKLTAGNPELLADVAGNA